VSLLRRVHPFILIAPLVLAALWGCPPEREGAAGVIDGDTIVIGGTHIRLHGIDAPEREQHCRNAQGASYPCGQIAAARLRQELKGNKVACDARYYDVYGREVATCTVAGQDLGDVMVRAGWAVDYSRYSNGKYRAAELEARTERRGLWAGTFEEPWRWREQHPRQAGR